MKLVKVHHKINPRALQKEFANKFEKELTEQGVIFFDEERLNINEDYLQLPREVTEIPSKDLGEYLNSLTQQKLYMRTLLGRAEVELDYVTATYQKIANPIYAKYVTAKISEKAKDRVVNSTPSVEAEYDRYVEARRKCTLIEQAISNIEDAIFMLSREVTRRSADFNDESRNSSVQGR